MAEPRQFRCWKTFSSAMVLVVDSHGLGDSRSFPWKMPHEDRPGRQAMSGRGGRAREEEGVGRYWNDWNISMLEGVMSPVIYLGRQARTLPKRCHGEGGPELSAVRRCHAPVSNHLRGQLSLLKYSALELESIYLNFSPDDAQFRLVCLLVLPGSDCSSFIMSTTVS